uniref:Bcl-2-like protein 15 n=1 Tax=Pogona vitticeps TaxID=103695 RepID=A0A6J0SMM4_9SAUR
MMNSMTFEEQTKKIVEVLFNDLIQEKSRTCFRGLQAKCEVRYQGLRATSAGTFDPAAIAKTLQRLGDEYNAEVEAKVQGILQEENMLKKFRETIEQLSRNSGLEYEQSFLAVAVKLFKCLARSAPAVVEPDLLIQTINGNPEVRGYIERQGGWENLGNREGQHNS